MKGKPLMPGVTAAEAARAFRNRLGACAGGGTGLAAGFCCAGGAIAARAGIGGLSFFAV